jgi:ribosome maturation factor RimP
MQQSKVEQSVQGLIEPVASSFGLELVLLQYRRESTGWILRILVDRPGGVSIDDCAELSREVSNLLDVEDLIPGAFRLEVSSPGLDRPLVAPEDFNRFAGKLVTLKTLEPVNGRRNFKGVLDGMQGDSVVIRIEQERYEIEFSQIEKANLVPVLEGV